MTVLKILFSAFMIISEVGLWSAFYTWMPLSRNEEAFFGVRVSQEFFNGEGRLILKRYRIWLLIALLVIEAVCLPISISQAELPNLIYARLAAFFLVLFVGFILFLMFYGKVKGFEIVEEKIVVALSLKTRRLRDYTQAPLEIVMMVMTALMTFSLIYFYPTLPERIPAFVDSQGKMEWINKSFSSIFWLPVLLIYLQGLLLLWKATMVKATMTLPAEQTEEFLHCKEESLRIIARFLDWFRFSVTALLCLVAGEFYFRTPENVTLIIKAHIVLGLLFGVFGLWLLNHYVGRWQAIDRKLQECSGRAFVQRRGARAGRFGFTIFYYNPNDPALSVESPVGLGYTFNLAHKEAYLHLAYWAALPVLLAWGWGIF
jgi:uncharacterized membrane protein